MSTFAQHNEPDLFNKTGFFEKKQLSLKHIVMLLILMASSGVLVSKIKSTFKNVFYQ
jgi:hypothetical protein